MSQSRATIFSFALGDEVERTVSAWPPRIECGAVIGRAEYLDRKPAYLVRVSAPGGAFEQWFSGDELRPAADARARSDRRRTEKGLA
jgi:hypothetical protein